MNDLNKAIFGGRISEEARVSPDGKKIFFSVASSIYRKKTSQELAEDDKYRSKSIPSYLRCQISGAFAEAFPSEKLKTGSKVYIEARQVTYKDKKNPCYFKNGQNEFVEFFPNVTLNLVETIDVID